MRQLQTKLKHNQLFDAATVAEKKAQEELAAAQAADKEKATAIAAKEGQLTADQNAANQAKASMRLLKQ